MKLRDVKPSANVEDRRKPPWASQKTLADRQAKEDEQDLQASSQVPYAPLRKARDREEALRRRRMKRGR